MLIGPAPAALTEDDATRAEGPWRREVLRLIADQPASARLTRSLRVGYGISPAAGPTCADRSGRIGRVNPRTAATAFRIVAVAEALSWLGLLAGMYVKYVPETSELGVRIFGPIHGGIFLAYVVVTLFVSRALEWSPRTTVLALACSIPPLATAWFERVATRNDRLPRREPVPAA